MNIWEIQFSIVEYLRNYSELYVNKPQSGLLLRNLTNRQLQMLMLVKQHADDRQQGVSLIQLAKYMNVKSPAASAMVNSLVKMGFLKRDLCLEDRREVRIELTIKIHKRFKLYDEILNEKVNSVLQKMGGKKAVLLQKLLQELEKGLFEN